MYVHACTLYMYVLCGEDPFSARDTKCATAVKGQPTPPKNKVEQATHNKKPTRLWFDIKSIRLMLMCL